LSSSAQIDHQVVIKITSTCVVAQANTFSQNFDFISDIYSIQDLNPTKI